MTAVSQSARRRLATPARGGDRDTRSRAGAILAVVERSDTRAGRARRTSLGGAVVAAALVLAACGAGTGSAPVGVTVLVTNGFGAQTVLASSKPTTSRADSVLGMLERNARVGTRNHGASVASIDGVAADGGDAWLTFVNGVGLRTRAARTRLHSGDQVWWDRHDPGAAAHVAAVVGSFPEPFADGIGGKRLPLRIECTAAERAPCNEIQDVFARLQLVASEGCLLCSEYNQSLRVVVGPWSALTVDPAADLLAKAPAASGVYARFERGGRRLELLGPTGNVVRTAGAGAGIIAATRYSGQPPVWYVTGTDAAGVAAAARAFNAATLDGHFAIAVVDQAAIPLPDALPSA
jgi:hypothetical protein